MNTNILETYEVNGVYKTEQDLSILDKAIIVGKESADGVMGLISISKVAITAITVFVIKAYIGYKINSKQNHK